MVSMDVIIRSSCHLVNGCSRTPINDQIIQVHNQMTR